MPAQTEQDWTGELEEVSFRPGDFLFHEHDQSYHFYVIVEGEVEIFKTDADGTVFPLTTATEGSSVGEFAMIDRQPRSASARAKTAVSATKISEAAYAHLLGELPDWAISVLRALVGRLRQTNEIMRRHQVADSTMVLQVDALEYDPDSAILDDSPFLLPPDEKK
jgi:CRP-like cAMP-binding protein